MAVSVALALSIAACISSILLLSLAVVELLNPSFRFWPPPDAEPWKKAVFMILFRVLVYGLAIASGLYLWHGGLRPSAVMTIVAILFILCGFAIAFWATGALGWSNAFGSKDGLRTDGIFAYSRNPIYLATWFGLAGWAIFVPKPVITATLVFWGLLYLAAIFLEERWLFNTYGEPYRVFCQKVRRFL